MSLRLIALVTLLAAAFLAVAGLAHATGEAVATTDNGYFAPDGATRLAPALRADARG